METPLLKVSRPVSACARCRNAKIRCDGKLPACSACERAGKKTECSSANDHFAKGKERSYVASLESRIEKLEKQLAAAQAQRGVYQFTHRRPLSLDASVSRGSEAQEVDDLVSDFGYLSINATASGYRGFGKEMSFARLVLSIACVEPLPAPSETLVLPDRNFTVMLLQECMRNVFAYYPILSDTALFGSLEACYQHRGRFGSPLDRWNVHMAIAIAYLCRSSTKNDRNYLDAVTHVSKALEEQDFVLHPGDIASVQAALLLVLYSVLDPTHFSCWYLVSVVCRLLIDIGGHQEYFPTIATGKRRPAELEMRRRLFYSTYSLDRLVSFSLVRAFSFSDESISIDPPTLHPDLASTQTDEHLLQYPLVPGDASLVVVLFRRAQSICYHRLFYSNRRSLYEPWQTRSHDLEELKEEFWRLSSSVSDADKQLLQSELYYMSILLIQPMSHMSVACSYGLSLLFEYSLGYARSVWVLHRKREQSILCTSLELSRAMRVATVLLEVITGNSSLVFDGLSPQPPAVPPSATLPTLSKKPSWEATEEATEALTQLDQVIESLGRRYGYPKLYSQFKADLSYALLSLQSKRGRS